MSTVDAWATFDLLLGLTEDLLPVPQPQVSPSPQSNVKQPGKVPGRINGSGQAVGFPGWTSHAATGDEITRWSKDDRLGVCLQTRRARAIDIDVDDTARAQEIEDFVLAHLGVAAPCRSRANSGKRLLLVLAPGEFAKRVIPVGGGAVELLGNGQQAIMAGVHPSGVPYEWRGGLPGELPEVTVGALADLAEALAERFGTGGAQVSATKPRQLGEPIEGLSDPVADWLEVRGLVLDYGRGGELFVACPWEHEHTSSSGVTEAAWFPAGTNGYERGNFRCLHAHCADRGAAEFEQAVGYAADDFEVLPVEQATTTRRSRLRAVPVGEFMDGPTPEWLVKGVLPKAALCMVYGASGAGKSFFVLDLVAAITRGVEWRGRRVRQANVLYVCAEGAGGFRNRVKAYALHHRADFGDAFHLIPAAPNFLSDADPSEIIGEIKRVGAGVVVVDTLAQVTPGGDENSAAEMGKALEQCRRLHEATGATVVLVHHAGKDAGRGARGWSGIRAAVDAEIEVAAGLVGVRLARVTKMKDGRDGEEFGFKLLPVPIGMDDDGDVIESCVVEPAEVEEPARKAPGGQAGVVWRAYNDLAPLSGEPLDVEALLATAVSMLAAPEPGKRDRRRELARRGLDKLCAEGWLVESAGQVRCIERPGNSHT